MRRRNNETKELETEYDYEIKIAKFSDMLAKNSEENLRKQLAPRRSHMIIALALGEGELERIIYEDGCINRLTKAKQREGGRRVGTSVKKNCCIFRK